MFKDCTEILIQLTRKALAEEQGDLEEDSGEEPDDASEDTEMSENDTDDHEETDSDTLAFFTELSTEQKKSNAALGARILCLFIPSMDKDLRESALTIFEVTSVKDLCTSLYERLRDFGHQKPWGNLGRKKRAAYLAYRNEVILTKYTEEMRSAKDHKRFYSYALLNLFFQLAKLKFHKSIILFGRNYPAETPTTYILSYDCPHRFALEQYILTSFVNGLRMSK